MKKLVVSLMILCLSSLAFAQTPSSVKESEVSYPSGNETVKGVLYKPESPSKKVVKLPAIIVIHEWWGLDDWVKEQARDLAGRGYITLAIDLYRGRTAGHDANLAHELMRGLPQDRAVRDLKAAFAYLQKRGDVQGDHIGAIGWCMGGGFALQLALNEPQLAAVVINYGQLATDEDALRKIHASIMGNFGGQDRGITPDDVNAFSAALKKIGKSADIKIYPDAGHAFQNPHNKDGYRPADTADAKRRYEKFFDSTLKVRALAGAAGGSE